MVSAFRLAVNVSDCQLDGDVFMHDKSDVLAGDLDVLLIIL